MVEAACHRCGREWDYTGGSDYYGTCPNCKTSVTLDGGNERAEPEAERGPFPSDRTADTVEVQAGGHELREVTVPEAIVALDEAVTELYELGGDRSEAVSDLTERIEERDRSVEEIEEGLEELAGYFEELAEEMGGGVEYEHIDTSRAVPAALEGLDVEEVKV
jgi:vacuolar-type H+-ATPase subunit I/STV1